MPDAVLVKDVTCVDKRGALLGEGPLWDPDSDILYWVDIKGEQLFRYHSEQGRCEAFDAPGMISALGLCRDGGLIAASCNGFGALEVGAAGLKWRPMGDPEADKLGNRFNDGKVDPAGGFWAGTMDNEEKTTSGAWWRLAPDGSTRKLLDGFRVTNGPAFDPDRSLVYLTDSAKQTVFVADTDGASLSAIRPFLRFGEGDGYPDGMEVDAEGCLWIAFWDGACLRRFGPDAALIQSLHLPIPRPTSVAFASDKLFVTSASIGLGADQLSAAPLSGGLFEVQLDRSLAPNTRRFG